MATSYTSLLGFALPVTGELDGTWGDVVNNSITQLVEDSVAGVATTSVAAGDWTLTTTGSGSANQARCAIIIPTGSPGVSRNIIAPSKSKAYIVVNQSDSSVVFKGSATTGVTIAAGKQVLVAWNGTDFVQVGNTGDVVGPASSTANGVPTFSGTSGKLIQNNSGVTIASGVVTATGFSGPIDGTVGASTPSTGVFTQVDLTAQGDLRLQDAAGGQYAAIQAPATITSSYTLTLPTTDGDAGQFLQTDGSGVLSWVAGATGDVTAAGNNAFTGANTFYNNTGQTFGTATAAQDGIILSGRAGGTGTYRVTFVPTTLTASRTLTVPDASTTIVGTDATQTLSNKTITQRVSSTASISSPLAWNSDSYDIYAATAQAGNFTINADAGTPTNGRKAIFRIASDATPRIVTFTGGASKAFKPVGVTLTTSGSDFTYTLTASKITYFGCIYNANSDRWEVVALSQEA